jgi:hypothetical protein
MTFSAMAAKVLYAAAEMRIPDLLAASGQTAEELARQTRAHPPSLRRLLRALTALDVLIQTGPDTFALSETGRALRTDSPDSVHALVLTRCSPEFGRSWDDLASSVRTGEPGWNRVIGKPTYEYFEQHPEWSTRFSTAMAQNTRGVAPAVTAAHDFARFGSVIDVGGGDGTLLAGILGAGERLRGVLFDLPSALADAPRVLGDAGVADRCTVVPGDFFVQVPPGGDVYVMKQILHNWDDEAATAILRNCRAVMAPQSRLLIVERVLPEQVTRRDRESVLLDLQMLAVTGGQERTEPEFRTLLAEAGFSLTAITEELPPHRYRVIEGTPEAGHDPARP